MDVYQSKTAKMDSQANLGRNLSILEVYESIENTYTYVKEVELEESMQAVFKQLISYEKQFDVCAAAWSVRTTTYEQTDTD